MLTLYYCDHHGFPLAEGHKFPLRKYALLRAMLAAEGLFAFEPAPLATADEVSAVHDREYVEDFASGALAPAAMRRIGFPWSPELVTRTFASAGSTIAAARMAVRTGFGGTLAGGTHHAFRAEGSGFCVFNDIAVAIHAMGRPRSAVIDLDVHQGDGTAKIFEGDASVMTLSLHGRNNFPFRKQASSIDVEFADGAGDDEYLEALAAVLPRVAEFGPEIVFYQSGVDGLKEDRLGKLALTHDGLRRRDAMVFDLARHVDKPIVVTLGGGYADPIEATARAHANTFRLAASVVFQGSVSARLDDGR